MNEDYLAYWGIRKAPFSLTPDPEMLYLSTQHSECLMRLKYAIFSQKGGALLVSDTAGNGKTSVLARLKNDLDDYYAGRVIVVFIDHPTLTPIEMIGEIANQLGGEMHTTEKIRALNYLRDRLFALYNENIKVVVIVDEGQMLKDRLDILGELRILLNFCVADAFLLTFIFSGQKPLDSVLRDMPEFWQRLPVRFFLRNLDFNDTKGLIRFRLEKVGGSPDIFTEDAFQGIYNYSEGCPRIICAVADLCLVIGFAKGARRIGFVEVSTACRDMESSGDGFHYYAFVKAGKYQTEPPREPSSKPPKTPKETVAPESCASAFAPLVSVPQLPDIATVACPSCAEANNRERRFCSVCDTPLFRKCAGCGTLIDTISNECPRCGTDIEQALSQAVDNVCRDMKHYDILENGHDIWLIAAGIDLEKGERTIALFPRGNMIIKGPVVEIGPAGEAVKREPADVVLTDRRIILSFAGSAVASELRRIDTCLVSDSGKLLGERYMLILGFNGAVYRVFLPLSSRKAKAALDIMASFIRLEMLI